MTEAGMAKIGDLSWVGEEPVPTKSKELIIPPKIEEGLRQSPLAWENFSRMAPSYQRVYVGWISDAKREETFQKRIKEAIERLEQNLPLAGK